MLAWPLVQVGKLTTVLKVAPELSVTGDDGVFRNCRRVDGVGIQIDGIQIEGAASHPG